MALTTCRDCGKQVSDLAPTCPACGAPIATATARTSVVAIERTAKRFKVQSLLSMIGTGIGLVAVYANPEWLPGSVITAACLIWYVSTRVRIWWHHD